MAQRYTLPHTEPDVRGVSRTFTIASPPSEPQRRLTPRIGSESSTFKRAMAAFEAGDRRRGDDDLESPGVLIASGTGMIRSGRRSPTLRPGTFTPEPRCCTPPRSFGYSAPKLL